MIATDKCIFMLIGLMGWFGLNLGLGQKRDNKKARNVFELFKDCQKLGVAVGFGFGLCFKLALDISLLKVHRCK